MTINWNPLVNTKFSLESDFSLKDGFINTLKFDSGKERNWLRNSNIPYTYSLKLALDNRVSTKSGKTEFEEFEQWFSEDLRYGILPFQMPRFGYKQAQNIKTPEMGIYKFIPNSVNYDRLKGIVMVNLGLEEIGIIPEVRFGVLATHDGKILLMGKGIRIMVLGV